MHPFTYNLYYILAWKIKGLFRFELVLIITGYPEPRTRPSVLFPWTQTLDCTMVRFWWVQVRTTVLNRVLPPLGARN